MENNNRSKTYETEFKPLQHFLPGYTPYTPQKSVVVQNHYKKEFERQTKSPLLVAGGEITKNHHYYTQPSVQKSNAKVSQLLVTYSKKKNDKMLDDRMKKIMMVLTLKRLRKMQALVRGFLFRKNIFPKLLQQHRLCESIFYKLRQNVMIKLATNIILEVITFNKYNENLPLYSQKQIIINEIVQKIIKNVTNPIYREIVTTSVDDITKRLVPVEKAFKKQLIFKLNNPEQYLVYTMFLREIQAQKREIAQEAIDQIIDEYRQQKQLESFFDDIFLKKYYNQIAQEALNDSCVEYIVEDKINETIDKFAAILAKYEYKKQAESEQKKCIQLIQSKMTNLVIGETILTQLSQILK